MAPQLYRPKAAQSTQDDSSLANYIPDGCAGPVCFLPVGISCWDTCQLHGWCTVVQLRLTRFAKYRFLRLATKLHRVLSDRGPAVHASQKAMCLLRCCLNYRLLMVLHVFSSVYDCANVEKCMLNRRILLRIMFVFGFAFKI